MSLRLGELGIIQIVLKAKATEVVVEEAMPVNDTPTNIESCLCVIVRSVF